MDSKLVVNIVIIGLIVFYIVFDRVRKHIISDQSSSGPILPANISWEEKRQHPRVEVPWKAQLEKPEGPEEVTLKNISLGGAFVVCENPLALQDKFTISVDLPEEGLLQLNAEVVWSNGNVPRDKVVNRGMGIRFVNCAEKDRHQLQNAITAAGEDSGESNG